jgi:hypothetical protein
MGNNLDNDRDGAISEFQQALYDAALRKLRGDPELQKRTPELERYIFGLVHLGRLKAPAGLDGRALDSEIVDAVDRAVEDFRHKRHLRGDQGQAALNVARAKPAGGSHDAAGERPKPFPDICIRGVFERYINLLEPRGEWPRAFLFEEVRMVLSMAIARGAGFGNGKLRYPHCHDLLVGESSLTHKNTSIGRTEKILREMRKDVLVLSNISSIEGPLEMMDSQRKSVALFGCEEYSYLDNTSQRKGTANTLPVLNDCYDGKDPLPITRKKALSIPGPFVNLVAGCTPAWLIDHSDKEGADLGRFNRFVVFYADQDRDIRKPQYLTDKEAKQFAQTFDGLLAEVIRVGAALEFEPDADVWLDNWFADFRKWMHSLPDNLRKLMGRDDDQVQIQALIYAAADGRSEISLEHVKAAAALIEWNRGNKMRLFGEVEYHKDQRVERLIIGWVQRGGGTRKQLWAYLGGRATADVVNRKLQALAAVGVLTLSKRLDDQTGGPLLILPSEGSASTFRQNGSNARQIGEQIANRHRVRGRE